MLFLMRLRLASQNSIIKEIVRDAATPQDRTEIIQGRDRTLGKSRQAGGSHVRQWPYFQRT
jgi:hypothetical protein